MRIRLSILIALIISLVVGLVWLTVGYYFMKEAFDNFPTRKKGNSFAAYLKRAEFDTLRYQKLKKREITLISHNDGIQLKGTLVYAPRPSKKTIIFSHGITDSRWFVFRGGRLDSLLNRGYNVLMFDQRAHGESEGTIPTYGYLEKYDLDQWVDTVANTFKGGKIGVEGVSMGAATAVLHAGEINPHKDSTHKVSFYIFDSSYSNLEEQFEYRLHQDYHLPNMALTTSLNIVNQPLNDVDITKVSPIEASRKIDVPVMLIHGLSDTYVPSYMSCDMYKEIKSAKMLLLIPNKHHAEAIYAPQIFWQYHDLFIKKYVKLKR